MKLKYILLIAAAMLLGGGFIYLKLRKSTDFEPLVKMKLASMISDASDGLYKLEIGHIVIDVTAGSVKATNVMLTPDSIRMIELEKLGVLGNSVYTVFLPELNLAGLSPADLINNKSISLDKLVLDSADIKIVYKKRNPQNKDSANLYERIAKKGQAYSIGKLAVNNIHLTILNQNKNDQVSSFKNLSATFSDIKIDSTTSNDSTRFLFAKDAVIFLKGYSAVSTKNKYNFSIDSVALQPVIGSMKLFDIRLKPIGTKDQFSARLNFMEDQYDIDVKEAVIKNINWFSLLSEDGLFGDEVTIKGGYIKVYDDRRLPAPGSKAGNYPHQMLMKVNFPIGIKRMLLSDMNLSYEEFNPKASSTGLVQFNNVSGDVENITNIRERIGSNSILKLKAAALLMDAGQLDANFRFDLANAADGRFEVDVSLDKMDGKKMNKTTEGLGLIKINELTIDKLEARIAGNNDNATGKIKFAYHDLSVDILKADDEGKMKKRPLLTFIAKNFMLHKSSPEKVGNPVKEYDVSYERDKQKSFFNLIWKTILEGIKKSVKGK